MKIKTPYKMKDDKYYLYQIIVDLDGKECIITNKTSSSIEVYIEKKQKEGVNCKQWFYIKDFEKRFKPIAYENIPKSDKVLKLVGDTKFTSCVFTRHPEFGEGLMLVGEGFTNFLYCSMIDK
jgi:hypothetical protein